MLALKMRLQRSAALLNDHSGVVVPGTSVAVISVTQSFQRSATTNNEGAFTFPLLSPGSYIVNAEHHFAPTQINERSAQNLIGLVAGGRLTKVNAAKQDQFSVNGRRASANYFTIDGVSANVAVVAALLPGLSGAGSVPGLSASGGTNNLVSLDALEEFKIQTPTFAPGFGRTLGAQVSMITRSGEGTIFMAACLITFAMTCSMRPIGSSMLVAFLRSVLRH